MKIFFIFIFVVLISQAKVLNTISQTKQLCHQGVVLLSQEKLEASFELFKPFWPFDIQELKSISKTTSTQLVLIAKRYGKILGTEYIKTSKVGKSFLKHTYTINLENHALRYMCVFYKPKKTWVLNSILWDDKIGLLFSKD